MNNIKVQGNKIKVLDSFYSSDYGAVIILLMIIDSSTNTRSVSVPLGKIAYVYDAVQKNISISKWSTLLSMPWEISTELRKRIVLAYQKQLVAIQESHSQGIAFSLTPVGKEVIDEIIEKDFAPTVRRRIEELCQAVKLTELKNQNLIW